MILFKKYRIRHLVRKTNLDLDLISIARLFRAGMSDDDKCIGFSQISSLVAIVVLTLFIVFLAKAGRANTSIPPH